MGRHASGKTPAQPLLEIKTRHRDIMYLILAGMTGVQICEKMSLSQSRLSVIRNSPLFKDELARLEAMVEVKAIDRKADLNARVHDLQFKALDTLSDILDDAKTVGVMKRAVAGDLLDLGTLRPQNNPANKPGSGNSADGLTSILEAAFNLAAQRRQDGHGNVVHEINVTPTLPAAPAANGNQPTSNSEDSTEDDIEFDLGSM